MDNLRSSFQQIYGKEPRLFSAPGRVNLIGEHTDYNQGFVLPFAANRRTYVGAAPRNDHLIRVCSLNLNEQKEFDLDNRSKESNRDWVSYVEGIARLLLEKGYNLKGADIVISSEVPMGAGLSSSAALEVSVGFALLALAAVVVDLLEVALAAQAAEHVFVGPESGLMDQLTAAFGVRNHAMLIDCRSLARENIPLNIPGMAVVVCDTGVKHTLATTAYNERRHECEQAVAVLYSKNSSVQTLRDLTMDELKRYSACLPDNLLRRARHVVSENERTLSAAEALKRADVSRLGELMNLSHVSLRNDYEVSCSELDLMVDLARQQPGVRGARMMGGGFGGTTVNLVPRKSIEEFCRNVSENYQHATGLVPTIMSIEADDGVQELT
ncbi:MAG TPA: galactokinase [Pyrinomonadaceae bacterium]|nr:galactokinase [Pyrinomonadaceae bacterium]